jgi:hypothetical protein
MLKAAKEASTTDPTSMTSAYSKTMSSIPTFACRKRGVSEGKKKKYRKKLGGQKIIAYLCNRIYIKV